MAINYSAAYFSQPIILSTTLSAHSVADTSRIVSVQVHEKADISRTITSQIHSKSDILRDISVQSQGKSDILRITTAQIYGNSDISRSIIAQAHVLADVLRKITSEMYVSSKTDVLRKVSIQIHGKVDTERIVTAQTHTKTDINRVVTNQLHGQVDNKRIVARQVHNKIDADRIVTAQFHGKSDISRILSGNIAAHGKTDVLRSVTEQCHGKTDACRIIALQSHGQADLSRSITIGCHNISDICRKIYAQLAFANTPRIDFTLSTKDLTPRYNIDSYVDYPKDTNYSQTLYNHNMLLTIKEHIFRPMDGIYNLVGVDSKEELLNNTTVVYLNEATALAVCESMASTLNKTLVWRCSDFSPAAISLKNDTLTFGEIVRRVFDWSLGIPNMVMIVTIRGDNLYVVQRGNEPNQYIPIDYVVQSNSEKDIWTLKTKVVTPYDASDTTTIISQEIWGQINTSTDGMTQTLFTGTISSGAATLTYEAGYMVGQSEMSTTITCDYMYLTGWTYNLITNKTVTSSNGKVITNYVYNGNEDLIEMDELTYDSSGNLTNTSITTYAPINFDALGHWVVNNYQNGVYTASSIVKGPQSSRVSPQLAYNDLTQKSVTPHAYVNGIPFNTSTYPVSDALILNTIANNLNYLNGKTEKRLIVEIYDQFIIDLVDYTVIIDGEEYYIDDNHIVRESEKWVQTLNLVRWY